MEASRGDGAKSSAGERVEDRASETWQIGVAGAHDEHGVAGLGLGHGPAPRRLVVGGIAALLVAKRKVDSREVGSMTWFLEGLKLDLEVFSRALEKHQAAAPQSPPPAEERSPDELAA